MSWYPCAACGRGMTEKRIERDSWVAVLDLTQGSHRYYCGRCAVDELDDVCPETERAYVVLANPLRMIELHRSSPLGLPAPQRLRV